MTENIPATDAEITTSASFLINIGNYDLEPESDELNFVELDLGDGDEDAKSGEEPSA